jgi:hypothetical protein
LPDYVETLCDYPGKNRKKKKRKEKKQFQLNGSSEVRGRRTGSAVEKKRILSFLRGAGVAGPASLQRVAALNQSIEQVS